MSLRASANFTVGILIGTCFIVERGDAALFEPIQPGANRSPGELIVIACLLIGKGTFTDVFDTSSNAISRRIINGTEDA